MIVPLLAAYLLFVWVQSYNNEQKVADYFEVSTELQTLKTVLNDPALYKPKAVGDPVEEMANEQLSIALYNADGLVVYTSNPSAVSAHSGMGKEALYADLYDLKQGYRSYTYKQPVFDGKELVGVFEVAFARDEWVAGVSNRSWLMLAGFMGLFLLIYFTIVLLVNRKLTKRLTGLKGEMTAFAGGEVLAETKTNNDEIGTLKKHFYVMRNQIVTAREVIDQEQRDKEYMIATISHDLKTPLTSIKAYAESLDTDQHLTETEQTEYRKVIIEKSDFMKQMLDDLLTYTLLQSPTYEMKLVPVDGGEFFDMLVSDYEALVRKKAIHLEVYAQVAGSYAVNPKQMMRVADNLISNAIQHTNQSGHVWLAAVSDKAVLPDWLFDFVRRQWRTDFAHYMYLIIQNDGAGIAKEAVDHVFDPLYQADDARSKRDAHGTGLGLSITKQIMEKHGGNVQFFSAEKIGTCVICCLPKRKSEGEAIEIY